METVLDVRDLGKAFARYASEWRRIGTWVGVPAKPVEEHWALRHVSFTMRRGEFVGLVGRNGAGKSTLLKLVAGTLRPSEGSVTASGRIAAILELGMGFNAEFTGRQNAIHAAGLMGFHDAQIDARMPEIEAFAEIGEYFDRPTRIYSTGMQMRVAFAVATAFRPDVLLIDEALAVGDVSFQAKCFARIKAMREEGCAMLFVSHSVEEIVRNCDRALFVDGGVLRMDAPSRDVTNAYLDHVWGSRRPKLAPRAAKLPVEFRKSGEKDCFAERPMYRKEEHRWGDGGARIIDYHLEAGGKTFPMPVESGTELRVVMRIVFDRDVAAPVYGLLVKTHDGIFLFGTNSLMASSEPPSPVSAGTGVNVEFSLPLGLNSGAYLLSLGVSADEGQPELVPLDRRYDAILLQVLNAKPLWGIVDLAAECRVLEGES